MADLLIHSMSEFSGIMIDALTIAGAREIVEIGAEFGGMSKCLADHVAPLGGMLTSIDPAPQPAFTSWVAGNPHVCHLPMTSLEALPGLAAADAWVIDGDHNWYTVYHELQAIRRICQNAGKPMLAFLHDIGWPSGRRDQYYAPDQIPPEFRQLYAYDDGAVLDQCFLVPGRGFRGMGSFAFALAEGGSRNGVLTAVEDFLAETIAAGKEMGFAEIPGVFGLGVIFDLDAAWSGAMADLLLPYHDNALLKALERNRLANYLRVIEFQDELAA
jgi:hypothetical protein